MAWKDEVRKEQTSSADTPGQSGASGVRVIISGSRFSFLCSGVVIEPCDLVPGFARLKLKTLYA